MAGYAVERYDEDPGYDMQGRTLYLNGAFSVYEAEKPEGPWKRSIFPEYLYDPGLFFDDDGKVYVVHG